MGRRRDAFRRFIDAFYDRVERDDLLSPFFPGGVTRSTATTSRVVGEVFGGPARYTDELGGYERMLAHHRDLGITPEQRRRFVVADERRRRRRRAPGRPRVPLRALAYAEWGTRLAFHNSQPGAEVVEHAPVPRWGWGEAPPFEGLGR